MSIEELKNILRELASTQYKLTRQERAAYVELLVGAAKEQIAFLRSELSEETTTARRRKAKSHETELDPKPPVKPVRVAAPSKPQKPKYSGNHAPSAVR